MKGESDMKKTGRRLIGSLLAGAMALTGLSGSFLQQKPQVSAATTNWKFDFGNGGAASGFTGVNAGTGYDAGRGYGFSNTSNIKDVSASGGGALSDAVQFVNTDWKNTFNVDLPNGLYRIKVTLGNTNRTSVVAEGRYQIMNMTGNNATDTILLPVRDGQLNIMATNGKEGYPHTMSALEIEWVSGDTELPPTIWFCGDSTVCNYYPKENSVQAGWGQVFDQCIDTTKWQVRDMATSGQFAKGFLDSGQFDTIKTYGKAGDMYIISIGINDTNKNYTTEAEYRESVTYMVQEAKRMGMQVVLVKQQGRASDVTNNPKLTGRWFGGVLDEIGAAENVQVIDLFNPWLQFCLSIGQDATYTYYCSGDDLHPNRNGAIKLAEFAASQIDWTGTGSSAVELDETLEFMLQNGNSGLYMGVEGEPANGANVAQMEEPTPGDSRALWRAEAATGGYYYIYSCMGDKKTYLLDLYEGKAVNGTNIGLWQNSGSNAQLFKFIPQSDGSYIITTKASADKSAIEIKNAYTEPGANVQEWERNGHACQTWFMVTPVAHEESSVTVGDLNEDGVIDAFDTALLKRSVQNGTISHSIRRHGDVNADAMVSAKDVVIHTDYILNRGKLQAGANGSNVYYAMDAPFNKGITEAMNAGFTSDAYVNLDNTEGSFIEFKVEAPQQANYLCTFKVANGSANNRNMKISVNGGKEYWMQDFLSTGAWTEWLEKGIVLPLAAGTNYIRLTSMTAEGGPNIDYLRTEWTDEPIAETYKPEEKPDTPTTGTKTIYIAGDSTVQTYRASYAPQQGWGADLAMYFDDGVAVANHSIAGRSSKSFIENGRLDTILNEIKEGDYLLVQFAINDSAASLPERYAPTCGQVPGTSGSYEAYMAQFIEGAKSKGATPILVTTVIGLKAYDASAKRFNNSYTNYVDACKQLAAYYKIPCIDLNTLMVNHYNTIGYDKAYTYHMISTGNGSTDMTHFTETGAAAVAKLVADAIKSLNLDISSNVK